MRTPTLWTGSGATQQVHGYDLLGTDTGRESLTGMDDRTGPLLSFFIPDLTVGGAEQVLTTIVNGLVDRGHNVELLVSRPEGKLLTQLDEGVRVIDLPPTPHPVLGVATHVPALVSYLHRRKPAVLFPHLTHTSIVCLAAKRILGFDTAVVPTHHAAFKSSGGGSWKGRTVRRLAVGLYPSSDRIIAVSNGVADTIVEHVAVEREDISVLYNPVDVESVQQRAREPVDHEWVESDETDVVLFVGRVAEQKDLETWLRTFERVHETRPSTRGIIVGQGPRRDHLREFADGLGIGDVVSFPGYVDNPYRYMGEASVFLLSSRAEGLPTVLIEALACGCQVVSTDCPSGPREILAGGECGRLAPVGDVDGLAEAVAETMADPIPPSTLRERAQDFSPDSVLDDYERFLEKYVTRD